MQVTIDTATPLAAGPTLDIDVSVSGFDILIITDAGTQTLPVTDAEFDTIFNKMARIKAVKASIQH